MSRRDRHALYGKPRPKKPPPVAGKAPGEKPSKVDRVKAAVAANDWTVALRIAKDLTGLGEDEAVLQRAWEALVRPAFLRQLNKDPDVAYQAGINVLLRRFS